MHRSVSFSDEDECSDPILPDLKTTQGRNLGGNKRPKAGDLHKAERAVLQVAIEIYCVSLLCNDPYPSAVKEIEWARAAWVKACGLHQVDFSPTSERLKLVSGSLPYNDHVVTEGQFTVQITVRTTHIRGQFKTKARDAVTKVYGFHATADASALERNRALFLQLKQDSAFIFKVCASGWYLVCRCPCSPMREEPWQNAR